MFTKIRSMMTYLLLFMTSGLHAQTDNLKASAEAGLAWVAVIDAGKYEEAWDKGALTLKLRIPIKSWIAILEATRKPLGSVLSRNLVDQRTAQNPSGLPAGDYMVLIYRTDFATKKGVPELVTLVLESDGKWRGLTYQVQ